MDFAQDVKRSSNEPLIPKHRSTGCGQASFVTGAITATAGFALNAVSVGFHAASDQIYNNSYGLIAFFNDSCVLEPFLNATVGSITVTDFLQYTGTAAVGAGGVLMLLSACCKK